MNKTYLINSLEEYFFVRGFDKDSTIVCSDFITSYQIAPHEIVNNIYDISETPNINKAEVWRLVGEFFRDPNGLCLGDEFNISVSQSLSWNNCILISKLIRDFFAYQTLKNDETYIFDSSDSNFLYFHHYFNKSSWILKSNSKAKLRDYGGFRILPFEFDHWIYRFKITNIMRFFQYVFLKKKIIGKTILFSDWTHEGSRFSKNKITTKPGIYLHKTAYFILKNKPVSAPKLFKDVITYEDFNKRFSSILKNIDLEKICYQKLAENYQKNHSIILRVFAIHKDMIDFYRPREVIFPTYAWDYYISLAQYLNKNNIPCSVVIDGFPFEKKINHRVFDETNRAPLFNTHFSQSDYIYRENIKHRTFSTEYKKITPLLADFYSSKAKHTTDYEIFDAIILTYSHDDTNPLSRPDLAGKILSDLIDMLLDMNVYRIGIKIKGPREFAYTDDIVNIYKNKCSIKILEGKFRDSVYKSRLFIGGLTSAAYECMLVKAPYYIYEPISNGYNPQDLLGNVLSDFYMIPITIDELKRNINNKISLKIPKHLHDDFFI